MDTPPSVLNVRGLHFSYSSQILFENFCWSTSNRLNVLLGPSGCGKTTLLRLLAGHLMPEKVDRIEVPTPAALMLQDDALFPWLTAQQNLDLVKQQRREEAWEILAPLRDIVGAYANQLVAELSFGQRRVVELLRILSIKHNLFLLDEPLNFLDKDKRIATVECIKQVASEGAVVVLSTHYADDFGAEFNLFRFTRDAPHQRLGSAMT